MTPAPAIQPTTWPTMSTAQRVTALTGLAAMRLSTRTMAARLGTSRNAVIGLARRNRIGLCQAPVRSKIPAAPVPAFAVHPLPAEETWAPLQGPVVEGNQCHWPATEPCRHPRTGASYCATHHAMAHLPTRPLEYNANYMGEGRSIVPIALEGGPVAAIYGGRKGARKGCE